MHSFDAELIKGAAYSGRTFFVLPANVALKFEPKGRIPVRGFIEEIEFRSSLNRKSDGGFYMIVNQPLQKAIGKMAGDVVKVRLEPDTETRVAYVPDDLTEALAISEKAGAVFERFSYSHKKEVVDWIEDCKKPETRIRRILKAIEMLEKYKK